MDNSNEIIIGSQHEEEQEITTSEKQILPNIIGSQHEEEQEITTSEKQILPNNINKKTNKLGIDYHTTFSRHSSGWTENVLSNK